jgi:hypothetical protein
MDNIIFCIMLASPTQLAVTSRWAAELRELAGANYYTIFCIQLAAARQLAVTSRRAAVRGELAGADYTIYCMPLAGADCITLCILLGSWL